MIFLLCRSFQDRSKRLKLHQFIAKNANVLFDEVLNGKNTPPNPPSSPACGDLCAVLPPFDIFVPEMDKKERSDHFLTVSFNRIEMLSDFSCLHLLSTF